jgi:hypothetical protein
VVQMDSLSFGQKNLRNLGHVFTLSP